MIAFPKWFCPGVLLTFHCVLLSALYELWSTLILSVEGGFMSTHMFNTSTTILFILVIGLSVSLVSISILQFFRPRVFFVIRTYLTLVAVFFFVVMTFSISEMHVNSHLLLHVHQLKLMYMMSTILFSGCSVWGACFSLLIVLENEQLENLFRFLKSKIR